MFDGSEQYIAASSRASYHGNPSFSAAFDPYAAPPPLHSAADPWSNDELLALLKLRSTTEIWFPDFTWEHVSRKLGELGFKRSGVDCKDKFEEVSRHFNSSTSNNNNDKNYSDIDELYHGEDQEAHRIQEMDDQDLTARKPQDVIINPAICKRKRRGKLEKFKGFCEAVVGRMMSKQEELHRKLIDDIVARDEERIAREEAWRIRETERARAEIETRAKEQKSAAARQAVIIQFLKQFTAAPEQQPGKFDTNTNSNTNSNSSSSFCKSTPPQTPVQQNQPPPSSPAGRRWPREEVVALINLRCETGGGGEGSSKGPLWERISQGMMEMGYKRSAKRCKEKWENINKYFRKTKDSSKKRSVNSRTCPYFHQLSCLYGDGTIVAPNAAAAEAAEMNQ
ncbi:trihelix transcription factor GTL2-like [Salvia divinorum]|uniref:Trihelix transcription factor GTL2-like n=1 Tax=Salvia divinorum TaxID=28513 RepID=A0ABD1I0E7_SALDI